MSDSLSGTPIRSIDRASHAYSKGRVCKEPSCDTRLSIYNSGRFCYTHEPRVTPRTRGRKVA